MTRRGLLKSLGCLGLVLAGSSLSYGSLFVSEGLMEGARSLNLYALNTGESLRVVYWMEGTYLDSSLREIYHLLRDHRNGQVHPIDVRLLDLLYMITKLSGHNRIVVISGYRSTRSNEYLYRKGRGVARESYHTKGMAVDIRVEGLPLQTLRDLALSLRAGGVGYYPSSGFVHLDTGEFRHW
ncbi:MAG: DUF882 domain-containing protein [Aquificaceae bacterium]|nr:DUF882 domain-containing protein [Aquificaceae bacterium]MDW8097534.1 YcbK family protein [Aquificaceae bacterium]